MNIICIYTDNEVISTPMKPLTAFNQIAFGLSVIMTLFEKIGYHVELLVFNPKTPMSILDDSVKTYNPSLVCFSAVYTQFDFVCKIAERVRKLNPDIYICLGGAHATLNPEISIQKPCFDAVCIGEGETAMIKMADAIAKGEEPTHINNLYIKKKDGTIEKNPQNEFIQNLDELPYINRKIWERWIMDTTGLMTIVAGRGCPFTCTYCSNHALSKVAKGKYFRLRTVENIIGELEEIAQNYPKTNSIYFEIETLSVDLDYTIKLCEALKKLNDRLKRPFIFGTNFTVTKNVIERLDELSEKMKDANFKYVNTGLESGSYKLRTTVLRRPEYTNADLIYFSKVMRTKGIDVFLYALLGIPDETLKDFKMTIEVARKCKPKDVYLNIVCPYPGTDLYNYAVKKGYMKAKVSEGERLIERRSVFLNLPGFSKRQILNQFRFFSYRVFKGEWPLRKIIYIEMGAIMSSNPILSKLLQSILNKNKLKKTMNVLWKDKDLTKQFDKNPEDTR